MDPDLKKKEEEQKSTKEIIFGALRKISGGSRKNSKVQKNSFNIFTAELRHINLSSPGTESGSSEISLPFRWSLTRNIPGARLFISLVS